METYPAQIEVDSASAQQALELTRDIREGRFFYPPKPVVSMTVDGCPADWQVSAKVSDYLDDELIVWFRPPHIRPNHQGRYVAVIRRAGRVWVAVPGLAFVPEGPQTESANGPDTLAMPALTW